MATEKRLIQGIPDTESVVDRHLAAILGSLRTNIETLFGVRGFINDRAVLVKDLVALGVLGVEGQRVYSKVPAKSESSASASAVPSVYSAKVEFDATGGLDTGTYVLPFTLPGNASIYIAWYDVVTEFTSDGAATISMGVVSDDATGILGATALSGFSAGWHACSPNGTVAKFTTKTTDERALQLVVGTAALTAGRMNLFFQYLVSE